MSLCSIISSRSLSRYEQLLKKSFILQDLKKFRHAPDFVTNPRLQNVYPMTICHVMENLFNVDGSPKKKLAGLVLKQLREDKVPPWRLLMDGIEGGRGLIW